MWTSDVNYVTQNNGCMQLLATLCVFQPLLHDETVVASRCHCYMMKPLWHQDVIVT